ncbi:MAG: hypothetical protein MUF20_08395 [Methylotetracoccus sp.]|jgi:hypothetical protein|nr:hypothetical protein [Methylotetracoccus sp.]
MFDPTQKTLALNFARTLARGDYFAAHTMCSRQLRAYLDVAALREQFERMIPLDWGQVDPIELEDHDEWPFVYVVLGGNVYSEAIFNKSFTVEDGQARIDSVEFGRP